MKKRAAKSKWTDAKNHRRCDLIDRKYAGTLTAEETAELAELQEEMLRYRHRVAPLPLEAARRLHKELLLKAQRLSKSGQSSSGNTPSSISVRRAST